MRGNILDVSLKCITTGKMGCVTVAFTLKLQLYTISHGNGCQVLSGAHYINEYQSIFVRVCSYSQIREQLFHFLSLNERTSILNRLYTGLNNIFQELCCCYFGYFLYIL